MIVTAVMPTYNEERHVGRALFSLLRQRGVDDFEILVVDGGSSDRTVDIVRACPEFGSRVHLLENPRRLQVYAWNLGCRAARGEYIVFVTAHAEYGPSHFRACLDALARTGADAVGPVQVAQGSGRLGIAIAWCMSSPFGVGNARFRFTNREEEVESVFSMCLRRTTFERLGGYDERIAFDEDGEFNSRLRAAGGRIVVSPAIKARYFVRESLWGLGRQMLCYGYWRRFTQVLHPRGVPPRIYAPPALLAGLALSFIAALTPMRLLGAIVPLAYLSFVAVAALSSLRKLGLRSAPCVAIALPCMHLWYGLGFWRALLTPRRTVLSDRYRRSAAR